MSNHVQHVIKICQALPLLIFYSVKGRGEPGSRLTCTSIEHLTRFEDGNSVWPKLMVSYKFLCVLVLKLAHCYEHFHNHLLGGGYFHLLVDGYEKYLPL